MRTNLDTETLETRNEHVGRAHFALRLVPKHVQLTAACPRFTYASEQRQTTQPGAPVQGLINLLIAFVIARVL